MKEQVQITFDSGNAAFDNGCGGDEAASILERLAVQLREGFERGLIYDSNGNRIGNWSASFPED